MVCVCQAKDGVDFVAEYDKKPDTWSQNARALAHSSGGHW